MWLVTPCHWWHYTASDTFCDAWARLPEAVAGSPPSLRHSTVLMPSYGQQNTELQCFQTRSPGNRPWARDLSEYEFLRKYSQNKLITKQESRIWKGKKKKKKASKSWGSDKVLVSAWFCWSSEAINYTWCLFHPVPRELGFFTPASVIESVTLATRLGWSDGWS